MAALGDTISDRDVGLGLAGLLILVYVEVLIWIVSRVFVLNFSVSGPNITVLAFLLVVSGWSIGLVRFLEIDVEYVFKGGVLIAFLGFFVSLATSPIFAIIGGVVMLLALTPLLFGLLEIYDSSIINGAGLGLLLLVGSRGLLLTASPYAMLEGRVILGAFVFASVILVFLFFKQRGIQFLVFFDRSVSYLSFGAFLFMSAGFLGFPNVLARFQLHPYLPVLVLYIAGVLFSFVYLYLNGVPGESGLIGWVSMYIGGVVLLLYTGGVLSLVSISLVISSALILVLTGSLRVDSVGENEWLHLSLLQLLAALLLFGYVSAYHWPYMPDLIGGFVGGRSNEVLFLFLFLLPSVTAFRGFRGRSGTPGKQGFEGERRAFLGLVSVGVLSLSGWIRLLAPQTETQGDEEMSMMTYNIHLYYDDTENGQYNLEQVRDLIQETGVDIVALQETEGSRLTTGNIDGVQWLAKELNYHEVYGAPTKIQPEGVAILSRWPILNHEVIQLPVERSIPALAVRATIDSPEGKIGVVSTHLIGVGREEQARFIADLARDEESIFILGDFNLRPTDNEYDVISQELQDTWHESKEKNWGSSIETPETRFDYIWFKGEWKIPKTYSTGRRQISDHPAIISTIETNKT